MGNGHSSEEEEGQSSKIFDTRCIAFDEDGNLRLGQPLRFRVERRLVFIENAADKLLLLVWGMRLTGDKARDKEAELKRVADADDPDDKVR